jgi:hypothetical protein
LQKYSTVAADALLEIGTAVMSLNMHLSQIIHFAGTIFSKISAVIMLVFLQCYGASPLSTLTPDMFPVSQNVVNHQHTVVLFGTSLSGYALLNASQTAVNENV